MKHAVGICKDLCINTVLSNGSTMYPDIANKILKITDLERGGMVNIKIIGPLEYSVCIGGSVPASLSTF